VVPGAGGRVWGPGAGEAELGSFGAAGNSSLGSLGAGLGAGEGKGNWVRLVQHSNGAVSGGSGCELGSFGAFAPGDARRQTRRSAPLRIGFVWCGVFPGREHRRRRPGRRQARRPAPLGSFGAKVFSAGEAAFLEWALGSLGVEATGSAGASLDNIVINSKIVRGCAWDIAKCFTVIAKLVVTEVFGGSGAGRQFAVAKRRRKGAYLAEGASRAPWRGNSMNQEVPSCDGR